MIDPFENTAYSYILLCNVFWMYWNNFVPCCKCFSCCFVRVKFEMLAAPMTQRGITQGHDIDAPPRLCKLGRNTKFHIFLQDIKINIELGKMYIENMKRYGAILYYVFFLLYFIGWMVINGKKFKQQKSSKMKGRRVLLCFIYSFQI